MVEVSLIRNWLVLLATATVVQGCATNDELFAEYDEKFCGVDYLAAPAEAAPVVTLTPVESVKEAQASEIASSKAAAKPWESAVYFCSESADLSASDAEQLDVVGTTLSELVEHSVSLAGFADRTGNAGNNQKLSALRAQSVRDYLIEKHGVDAERITSVAEGSNASARDISESLAHGRRVELHLLDADKNKVAVSPTISAALPDGDDAQVNPAKNDNVENSCH